MTYFDMPPFFVVCKDGNLAGFDVDLAKDIAKELGIAVEFNRKAKTFDGVIDLIIRGEADIGISKLSRTLSREKKVSFTNPYIVLRQGLQINRLRLAQAKKGRQTEEFIRNFEGELGVLAASSYVEYAKRKFPKATLKEYDNLDNFIKAVTQGDVIAIFRDELEIKKVINCKPKLALKLQSVVFKDTKDQIAIAVSPECPHLLYWLNVYLDFKNIKINANMLLHRYQELLVPFSKPDIQNK